MAKTTAQKLLTREGLTEAYGELYDALCEGGSRDDISAMTCRKHVLRDFLELQKEDSAERRHKELLKAHTDTQALLRRNQGSGSTSFDSESLQIPTGKKPTSPKN